MMTRQELNELIIRYETEDLHDDELLLLFQELVNTGLAWTLQGHYGRTASYLLENGHIQRPFPYKLKEELRGLANEFTNDEITSNDIQDVIEAYALSYKIDFEIINKEFQSCLKELLIHELRQLKKAYEESIK